MQHADDLQQLVEQRLRDLGGPTGPMSARRAAGRSSGLVSYETLRLLLRGQHSGSISRETAIGLAQALEVSLEQVLRLAGKRIPLGPFTLPERADTLIAAERAVVLSVVDAILDAARRDRSLIRAVANTSEATGGTSAGAVTADSSAEKVRNTTSEQQSATTTSPTRAEPRPTDPP